MGKKKVEAELVDDNVGKEVAVSNAPANLISQAIEKGTDLTQLQTLLDLQIKWEANEAKKAFIVAMAKFKENPPEIIKDKKNTQYDSSYSSLENFVNSVTKDLSDHGLSHNWDVDQTGDNIKVSCRMTHQLGHSESTSMVAPPDDSGSKNPIQKIKSTVTYLKLATLEAITGLASKEGSLSDDGNASGTVYISEDQENTLNSMIDENIKDEKYKVSFLSYMKVESMEMIPAKQFKKAETAIKAAIKAVNK